MCKVVENMCNDNNCGVGVGKLNHRYAKPRILNWKQCMSGAFVITETFNFCPKCGYEIPDSW